MNRRRHRSRVTSLAVATGLLLAACGGDGTSVDRSADPSPSVPAPTTALADAPAPTEVTEMVELDADLPRSVAAGPVTWEFTVTNTTEAPVTLTFPTGQPGDVVLATAVDPDTAVHRWSDGRFFDQAVREVTLDAGASEPVALPDDLTGVEPGTYEIVLSVAVVGPPEPVETTIRVTEADG